MSQTLSNRPVRLSLCPFVRCVRLFVCLSVRWSLTLSTHNHFRLLKCFFQFFSRLFVLRTAASEMTYILLQVGRLTLLTHSFLEQTDQKQLSIVFFFSNNNNSNNTRSMFIMLSSMQIHCQSSLGSLEWGGLQPLGRPSCNLDLWVRQ